MPDQPEFHNVLSWGDEERELRGIQTKFLQYFPTGGIVLDLGSGRGIFLDLLKEHGFTPVGVEMDETMYQSAKKRDHIVHKNDALSYLSKTRERYDGIMASHIIEHMPIEDGVRFIQLIKDHLKPGGVAIVVTPRPGSLWAAENFWLDTTHIRPYPYELMRQLFMPLQVLAGGIEPDSQPLQYVGRRGRWMAKLRRPLLGRELFDFVYGGGVSYIVVQK